MRFAAVGLAFLAACEGPLIEVGEFEVADAGKSPTANPRTDAAADARASEEDRDEDRNDETPGPGPADPGDDAADAASWLPFGDAGPGRLRDPYPRNCVACDSADPWVCDSPIALITCQHCACCMVQGDCNRGLLCIRPDPAFAGLCRDPNRGPP